MNCNPHLNEVLPATGQLRKAIPGFLHHSVIKAPNDFVDGRGTISIEIILNRIVLFRIAELRYLYEDSSVCFSMNGILGHTPTGQAKRICTFAERFCRVPNSRQVLFQAHGYKLILRRCIYGNRVEFWLKRHAWQILGIHEDLAIQHEVHNARSQSRNLARVAVPKKIYILLKTFTIFNTYTHVKSVSLLMNAIMFLFSSSYSSLHRSCSHFLAKSTAPCRFQQL